jgi:ZIP family zinc transporter
MQASTYIAVLLLAVLSGLATLIGVVLAFYVSRKERWVAIGIGFSAGIMSLIALLELIPESLVSANSMQVGIAVGLGAALIGVMHYVVPHTHLFKERGLFGSDVSRTAYLVALGLILHDFPEGFAMANAYISAPTMGVAVALAITLHNIPEEFAIAVPAVATKSRRFLFRAAFVSGLAEPLGAIIGLVAASINRNLVPLFMAFAAGAMLFISVHELLPMAKRYGRIRFFVLGLLASVVVYYLLASILTS